MDQKWKHVLDGYTCVAFSDIACVDLSADEDEFHDYESGEVDDSAAVVVEEEEFGVVEDFTRLHKALMLAFEHVLFGGEMLGEELAVVFVLIRFLGVVGLLNMQDTRLRLFVNFIELYFLE